MIHVKNFIEFLNEKKDDIDELRVCIVGDIIMSDDFSKDSLEDIMPILKSSDICIGNIEITDIDKLDNYAKILADAGFTHISVCNNHSLDNEIIGLQKSIDILSSKLKVIEKETQLTPKGFKVNIVNFTTEINNYINKEYINHLTTPEFKPGTADNINIAYLHWKGGDTRRPNKEQRMVSDLLFNQGHNIVVGTGPHTSQRIENTGNGIKAYSLGDFNGNEGKILILDFKSDYIENIITYNIRTRKGIIKIKNREIL